MIDRRTPQRLAARWRLWRDSGDELKRRVRVEQYLLDAASGKQPLPDADKCRELALRLGIIGFDDHGRQ